MRTMKRTGSLIAIIFAFGMTEVSVANTCNLSDVTLDGNNANLCGLGSTDPSKNTGELSVANTPVNDPQLQNDYMGWDVNLNGDGGSSDWQFYYKRDLQPDGTTPADISFGAGPINLQITSTGGNDQWSTGMFTVNAYNPMLIVLGDGAGSLYHWYYFEGLSGPVDGTWADVFGGKDLSNITAYAISGDGLFPPAEIPIPAAVWLFGSGLIGLAGIARRKKN